MAAARNLLRRMLHLEPSADVAQLVTAVFEGKMISDTGFSVGALASATSAKPWLATASCAKEASQATRAGHLCVLLKALPLLQYALTLLRPDDASVAATLADVQANFAVAVSARSVKEAVDGLLVPFFRSLGEEYENFQRSSTVRLPLLASVWAKQLLEPSHQRFLQLVSARAAPDASPPDAALSRAVSDLKKTAEKQAKELRKLKSHVTDDEASDVEEEGGGKSRSLKKREWRERKKARDDAAAADSAKKAAAAKASGAKAAE